MHNELFRRFTGNATGYEKSDALRETEHIPALHGGKTHIGETSDKHFENRIPEIRGGKIIGWTSL